MASHPKRMAAAAGRKAKPARSRAAPMALALVAAVASAYFAWTSEFAGLASSSTSPPAPRSEDPGVIIPEITDSLQMWDPVAINHTRRVRLDDSGRIHIMRTMSLNPPIFEIENFLEDEECETIMKLALRTGLFKSDHTFLDGSNKEEKDKDTSGISKEDAEKLFRYSDQTWLPHNSNSYLQDLMERAKRLAMLPDHIAKKMEHLQVVKYKEHGHYESHFDSEPERLGPCCGDPAIQGKGFDTGVRALDLPLEKRCRLCRYMTVLYYLVDTEEGGGTVFPLADTSDEEYQAWNVSTAADKYKQTRTCAPGVVVKPQKGKAVMWYNHHNDRGWLGEQHERSLHGGCNVIKGRKWIANHWISHIPHPDKPRELATSHY